MDSFENIKNSIESARNIVIVTENNADEDVYASVLGVFFALKNKHNIFLPKDKNPENLIKYLNGEAQKKKIIISLKSDVSEISYERKNGSVELSLVPKNGNEIKPEQFSCKLVSEEKDVPLFLPPFFDLIIAFNIKSFSELEKYFNESPESIYNCSIINVDKNSQNENYGEINIIEEDMSLSERMSSILKSIQENVDEKSAGFLLWGIIDSINEKGDPETISTIKWLVEQGGNIYFNHINPETKRKLSLLEKIIKNLNFLKEEKVYISSLSENDFKELESSSSDLSFIIEKMKNYFSIPSFMLLWEGKSSPTSIKCVFYSEKDSLIDVIKTNYNGSYKGKGGIFLVKSKNLPSAEKELSSLLWKK
ncbi:MAG TPA: hypothetical protein PK476_01250 [Candidatus Pacearchaeota archaeon]|nr:hypothetical protein [Candidatus Pacearchaeota archaeon]HQM24523.1 hypothetical protein [Candidatus Pacearchaeota archaeon]